MESDFHGSKSSKIVCWDGRGVNAELFRYCLMEQKIQSYNIRLYAILFNDANEVLLSKEDRGGVNFTKFPGGGHQLGEGLLDGLKRELYEELGINDGVYTHFYTTDYFQRSGFDENQQLISVYYLVKSEEVKKIQNGQDALDKEEGNKHWLFWKKLDEMNEKDLTFPIDRLVLSSLKANAEINGSS